MFGGYGVDQFACIPLSNFHKNFPEIRDIFLIVTVREDADMAEGRNRVIEAMRRRRHVPHRAENDFDIADADFFSNLVNRTGPDKGAYVSLSIPLRNRAAQANQIRSELEYGQSQLLLQQQKNQIILQVRNAAFALEQARAGVESARAARDYAQQSLEAEQKKYELEVSTSYLVLQQQSNTKQAASNYVAALSTYEKARVALDQYTATILDRNGISMEDAASGQVSHVPAIPGLQPNQTPSEVKAQPVAK